MIELDGALRNELRHDVAFPLPARVAPLPWEDLTSLIIRTAAEMHYSNPLWIVRPQEPGESVENPNLCDLWKSTDYRLLQKLLNLDEETLYHCTYHSFAARLQTTEERYGDWRLFSEAIQRPLLGGGRSAGIFRTYSAAAVCPSCLKERIAYGRLYWNFCALVICPVHNVFLIRQCPHCRQSIPMMRVSLTHCPRCKVGDYRLAEEVSASESSFFQIGQRLICHHFTGESVKQEAIMKRLKGSPLLELSVRQYFQLLWVLQSSLSTLFPDDPFLQVDSDIRYQLRYKTKVRDPYKLSEWVALTGTFHYIFASWPETFLDALVQSRGQRIVSYEWGDFRELALYTELSDPPFLFLREAYESYLKTRYIGESRIPAAKRYSVTITQAQQVLDVSQDEIDSLVDQGLLRIARRPIKVQNKTLQMHIKRESVERLCQEWEGLIPLSKVAFSLLGAKRDTLRIVYEKGWLIPERDPDIDGYSIEMYNAVNVNAFIAVVLSRSVSVPCVPQESVSLSALSTSNTVSGGRRYVILRRRTQPKQGGVSHANHVSESDPGE